MYILGMGGSDHSFSACLLSENGFICAIEEERITREKNSLGPKSQFGNCRKYCLNEIGIDIDMLDIIVGNDILYPMTYFPVKKKIELINHHIAHAYSAYFSIPNKESAILIVDGTGSNINSKSKLSETITYAVGRNDDIEVIDKVVGNTWNIYENRETLTENSIGDFYRKFTEEIGFGYLQDGKTMGLAPYGTDRFYYGIKEFVKFTGDGQIEIKINEKDIKDFVQDKIKVNLSTNNLFNVKADIAWAAQAVLEDCMFYCLDYLYKKVQKDILCIAGGVGLNSVVNGKIKEKTNFKHIFIPPYTSDSGTAIGAAFYGYKKLNKKNPFRSKYAYNPFTGHNYSDIEIKESLNKYKEFVKFEKKNNIYINISKDISNGKIIGWFQGKSEMGPRSLGHRSILADPRNKDMKNILNYKVKKRENFRPFAPAILEEYASEYFDVNSTSAYMLFVYKVKDNKIKYIPSVTHVDGTARVQTVNYQENPIFYKLINEFYKLTNIPILLNTSFNIKGEPIVESPEDAIKTFIISQIDVLVIGSWYITKI